MKPLLKFPCYEPAGHSVDLTETDLLQHMLVVGSTGCGKTTLLTSAIQQLIENPKRIGLLVLDAKADGLVADVLAFAKAAGRANDVIVFGPDGSAAYDLFEGLQSLDDVDRITRRLMLGVDRFSAESAFWAQATSAMVSAALVLLYHLEPEADFQKIVDFMRAWFLSGHSPPSVETALQRMRLGVVGHPLDDAAADQVKLWQGLDHRTKSNVQACLLQVLRPLMGSQANACFHSGAGRAVSPSMAATAGKICVVSISALAEPDLGKFFFRIAKSEFFEAVQTRGRDPHRLCGVVADELPLVVTASDVAHAGTIRSKGCFFLAATQGLDGIVQQLGPVAGRTLISHFNTVILMRCREIETSTYALIALGNKPAMLEPLRSDDWAGRLFNRRRRRGVEESVCPLGALGQLAPHQAYVSYCDGRRTFEPCWLVPWFELKPSAPPPPTPAISSGRVEDFMRRAGFREQWSPGVMMAVNKLSRRTPLRTLKKVKVFFLKFSGRCRRDWSNCPRLGPRPCLKHLFNVRWPAGLPRGHGKLRPAGHPHVNQTSNRSVFYATTTFTDYQARRP